MHRRLLLAALLCSPLAACADAPDWENEQVCGRNRLPGRAACWPYGTLEEAKRGELDDSPWIIPLNGDWAFTWAPTPADAIDPATFDTTGQATLPVPSSWQTHGHGVPIYVSAGYPFRVDPPRVTSEPPSDWTTHAHRNPVGTYAREFEVPESWAGRRVVLHFAGVEGALEAWLNGRSVGYSQGNRTPAEFDVTDDLRPGANRLALRVYRFSDGSYLEDQDMWRLAGVHRDVVLCATPPERIVDLGVRTDLDGEYRDAELAIDVELEADHDLAGWSVQAELFDGAGQLVFDKPLTHDAEPILNRVNRSSVLVERTPQRGRGPYGWIKARVSDPAKWTAETPNLYRLVVTLVTPDGEAVHCTACDVGFREVDIRDGRLLVNGRPIKLCGVNRHEHDPAAGHAITPESMAEDLLLMKRANINAVRTAHYPNDPRWYALCDRLGMYVLDEVDIETHGLRGKLASDPRWAGAFLDRGIRLVERDKNHPCVIGWSLGNESGWGPNFAALAAWIREADPTRFIHYEGAQGAPDPEGVDVISRFYPRVRDEYLHPDLPADPEAEERPENARWERLLDLVDSTAELGDSRPVLASEYAHAMGNAMGNLGDYWREVDAYDRLLGGFIWDWADQGLLRKTPDGEAYFAYGGDFGENPNHGAFCLNGVVMADRSLTAKYWAVKKAYQPVAIEVTELEGERTEVRLANRFGHTDLAQHDLRWTLEADGEPVAHGETPCPAAQPGDSATVAIELGKPLPAGECWLRVAVVLREETPWAPAGHELAWSQTRLDSDETTRTAPPSDLPDLEVRADDDTLLLVGEAFAAAFDRQQATLVSLRYGESELLATGFQPNAYRAPTDNDRGFGRWLAREWREAGLPKAELVPGGMSYESRSDSSVEVTTTSKLVCTAGEIALETTWLVLSDGVIHVDSRFLPTGELPPLPRLGVTAALRPGYDRLEWFGRGPWESYPDRLEACDVGKWRGRVEDQATPYPKPQETGSHAGARWVALTDATGSGLLVASLDEPFSFSALPYTAADLAAARRWVDLKPRSETVLSIDAKQCGLGNSSCGPGVLARYAVLPEPTGYSFALAPIAARQDPSELARRARSTQPHNER